MTAGRPDYTSQSLIKGSDAGTHRTVAVDPAGNLLTLIKGQFGGAPVTIAVDAGGNILGILQGDYAGSLKTLAVDDKGRMLAVLTDPEDVFGNPHYMGSAELAARLGSPNLLERRGQVVFMDPGGLDVNQYLITTGGAASAAVESGAFGPLGALSYKLTAGPDEDDIVTMAKYLPVVTEGKYGIETTIALDKYVKYFTLGLTIWGFTASKDGAIRIDVQNALVQYYDSSGGWTDLASLELYPESSRPHMLKLVVDPSTGKYVRGRVDNQLYDMSALSLHIPFAIGALFLLGQASTEAYNLGTVESYLGNFIMTVNEE